MFHGLVREIVLEHSSLSSQAGSFLTTEIHLENCCMDSSDIFCL